MNALKKLFIVGALCATSMSLSGCVVGALVPVVLNLAAEGATVAYTDKTITENLKDVINEKKRAGSAEVARNDIAPIPPHKPTPPQMTASPLKVIAKPMEIIVSEN